MNSDVDDQAANNPNEVEAQSAIAETAGQFTPEAQRERRERSTLLKSQAGAFATTVWSASDLNVLLEDLLKLRNQDVRAQDVPVSQDVLRHINLVPRNRPGSGGILKNAEHLDWPEILRDPAFQAQREKVQSLLPQLIDQAKAGQVEGADLEKLAQAVIALETELGTKIQEAPSSKYIPAKRFVDDLKSGVRVLGRADAKKYLQHPEAAQAKNVRELVQYMGEHDLRFAPAVAGDEKAYLALYQTLASYDVAANQNGKLAMRSR